MSLPSPISALWALAEALAAPKCALRSIVNARADLARPSVQLVRWRHPLGIENFGDHLSEVIVSKLLADRGHFLGEGRSDPMRLLAVGSILHFAKDGDYVWGSGIYGGASEQEYRFKNLHVHAVRGPMTYEFLKKKGIRAPEIFGDPALLLPRLLPGRFESSPRQGLAIVPHYKDLGLVGRAAGVLSPFEPWNHVVAKITSAAMVVSSSLHGLIVADAYGVPARYVRLSEAENILKFTDYYAGTGRPFEPARSIPEAIEMGGAAPPAFNADALIGSFPFDLWEP